MISALNKNSSQNPCFTSVVPVRVFVDGMETFNQKNIRAACRQLSAALAGPTKNDAKKIGIIREFAKFDPDYRLECGYNGYPKINNRKNMQPSDYFRCIADNTHSYLFTGEQAKKLKELGKAVGQEQQACKARKIANSFDLQVAKRNYGFTIANFIRSTKLRLRETFDPLTKIKNGKPVELNIHMSSNGKYAQSNFKMFLDNITFSKAEA